MPSVNDAVHSALLGVSLFSDLDPDTLGALAQIAYVRTVRKGDVVFRQGEPGEELLILVRGSVTASVATSQGGTMTVGVLGAGEFFGEVALLDGFPRSATVTALEDLQLVVVDRETFSSLLQEKPSLALALLRAMARRSRAANETLLDIATLDVAHRLRRRLLGLARSHGSPNPHGVRITIPLSGESLAGMIAAPLESVVRSMQQMEEAGLVRMVGDECSILDLERLARFEPAHA